MHQTVLKEFHEPSTEQLHPNFNHNLFHQHFIEPSGIPRFQFHRIIPRKSHRMCNQIYTLFHRNFTNSSILNPYRGDEFSFWPAIGAIAQLIWRSVRNTPIGWTLLQLKLYAALMRRSCQDNSSPLIQHHPIVRGGEGETVEWGRQRDHL